MALHSYYRAAENRALQQGCRKWLLSIWEPTGCTLPKQHSFVRTHSSSPFPLPCTAKQLPGCCTERWEQHRRSTVSHTPLVFSLRRPPEPCGHCEGDESHPLLFRHQAPLPALMQAVAGEWERLHFFTSVLHCWLKARQISAGQVFLF